MDPDGDFSSHHDESDGESQSTLALEPSSADERSHHNNKRLIQDSAAHRPFKRQKGRFNADYLELLNRDIDDAAHGVCLDDDFDLPRTQLGLTTWSTLEKRQFFEALARLGRHDLPGIASRVNSKSMVEIKHYINFLEEAHGLRRRLQRRSFLETAEYPAAVELSQPCCHAQEEAADAIALRQEHRETQREEKKWGCHWDISPMVAQRLDHGHDADASQPLPFAQLFHLGRWLRLSERFFMNSSIPGGNWTFVDHVPPSVWATAFDDFYSLVVSITRRLVQTTLFISMSRIRAKNELIPNTRNIVRKRDAEAAVASLGMAPNARQFWLKSARRLRLNVYQELLDQEEGSDEEPMTYDQVESSLDEGDGDKPVEAGTIKQEAVSDHDQDDLSDDSGEDNVSPENQEQRDISREANEVLWYSATDLRDFRGARRALERAIAMERRQEEQAERGDEYASYQAEVEMWEVLQRKPPMDIPKKQDPGPLERSNVDVESIYPMKRDWTSQLKYRSEWEAWDQDR
ncbi:Homeodomain-like protein [Hirsutella rhossiliensis]|uniref:Homeodomain-like protein n=1 Tax=Hirsutella rhossiliensis TaxID=111463 RepID=A0A9P8N2H4_9HYPO|nr:Homeodomain-like protein [Hirsutella rhossiliensis]KAH0965649.1 Homeodomain-like protein [Hirsutella rhossiliensis]